MPQQKWIHEAALGMLNDYRVKELPIDLRTFLDEVEESANVLGGSIGSRQIVALTLATYRRLKKLENSINK